MESRSLIVLLAVVLMAPAVVAQAGLIGGSTVALDPITTNNGHLGCVELNGRIFVTSRGLASLPPHLIYEFDCTGALVGTYQASAAVNAGSAWGYRDGCVGSDASLSPNPLLYFGYEGGVEVIDPTTLNPIAPPAPLVPLATFSNATVGTFRGMAWDPTGDGGLGSILTGDFGGPLEEVSATALGTAGAAGSLIVSYPNPAPPNDWSIYGLAYDSVSGNLWANSAPDSGPISEIDLTTTPGTLTGRSMDRADPVSAQGGLSPLSPGSPCIPAGAGLGGVVLIALDQAAPDAYSLYDTSPGAQLLTGVSGGAQDVTQKVVYGGGSLDWSLVSSPAGSTGITGVPAITVINLGAAGTLPSDTFVNNFVPGFSLALTPPFSAPGSGPGNPSLLVADGVLGGLLFPGFCDASIHGFFPMDLTVDDATAATIGPIPAGILPPGTGIYIQSIYLDGSGNYRPTNMSGWDIQAPVSVIVEAMGTNSFNSVTTSGFFKITNVAGLAITQVQFDWVTSPNPLQATMVFDTDQVSMADVFEGGNGTTAGCLGTYRNGSDAATGLVYDAMNTVPATPCDPLANTGWIGSNPTVADAWKTLDFRFTSFNAAGQVFEFDCDTDGGAGITGGSMDGMVVTITTASGVLTGVLTADPADPNRSFLNL